MSQPSTIKMMEEMLKLQEEMNTLVNPDWINANNNWLDAIMVESVEAFDHTNWKWWKNADAPPDWDQVRLELVDIWHFLLSKIIEESQGQDLSGVYHMVEVFPYKATSGVTEPEVVAFRGSLKEIIMECVMERRTSLMRILSMFMGACYSAGMSFEDIYVLYMPKTTLNIFRQKNGYKQGTYQKMWGGVEDNVVLSSIIADTPKEELTSEYLYSKLEEKYNQKLMMKKVEVKVE